MSNEANKILSDFLNRIQKNATIRKSLAMLILFALMGVVCYFIYEIIPRHYNQSITGGDILSNRHYLTRNIQEQATASGLSLEIKPTNGSREALTLVDEGKLDFAFIQGGLELQFPNVVHVATVAPELLHVLVRPEIKDIASLKGKRINLGSKKGGTRIVTKQILSFSGLTEGVDYVETNIPIEELLSMDVERMPEAVVITSFAPSDIVDYLVKEKNYALLEIPFPASLSLRLGWVADSKILAYTYNVAPPVPAKDIKTIGVNLHLVANKNVDPRAVFKVLESLYSPDLEVRLKIKMDENQILVASGYPLAAGTKMYLNRNNPLFSGEMVDQIKALFGLVLSVGSTLLVIFKWFKGEPIEPDRPATNDKQFLDYIERVLQVERDFTGLDRTQNTFNQNVMTLQLTLSAIKAEALEKLDGVNFDNPQLPQHLLMAITDTRTRISSLS